MEAQALDRITALRPVVVEEHIGMRMKLRYLDGRPEPRFCHFHEFDIEMILPCGSARVYGRELISGQEYWDASVVKFTSFDDPLNGDATSFNFRPFLIPESVAMTLSRNPTEIGAKLELLDPLEPEHISVGTVKKLLPNQFLEIGVDGAIAAGGREHRIIVHATSPTLLPAGFAEEHFQNPEELAKYFRPPTPDFR